MDEVVSDAEHLVYQATSMGGSLVVADRYQPLPTRMHRILVLSADEVTCKTLSGIFEKAGMPTKAFTSLTDALASDVESQAFHLVVIDEDFPPAGGLSMLSQLREDPRNNRLSIMLLISTNAESNVMRALDLGASDYVIRPYSPNHLLSRVRRLLSRRPQEQTHEAALRVHIVGQNSKTLVLIATILHQQGLKIFLSNSCADAAELFDEVRPNIFILDVSESEGLTKNLVDMLQKTHELEGVSLIQIQAPEHAAQPQDIAPLRYQGTIPAPINPGSLSAQTKSLIEMPRKSDDVPHDTEHLNREIQRIMGSSA